MLIVALADRQQVVEGHARRPLPEGQHGGQVIGRKPDIHPRFRELHGLSLTLRDLFRPEGLARDPGA
jgi:hypothetical protein